MHFTKVLYEKLNNFFSLRKQNWFEWTKAEKNKRFHYQQRLLLKLFFVFSLFGSLGFLHVSRKLHRHIITEIYFVWWKKFFLKCTFYFYFPPIYFSFPLLVSSAEKTMRDFHFYERRKNVSSHIKHKSSEDDSSKMKKGKHTRTNEWTLS